MERKELVSMLIRFYNLQAGTSLRTNNPDAKRAIECMLDYEQDVDLVKKHIRIWTAENEALAVENDGVDGILNCMRAQRNQESKPNQEKEVSSALGVLEQAIAGVIAQTQAETIKAEIMGNVQQTIQDFIKSEYGHIERRIDLVINDVSHPEHGILHEKFDTVLKFVANDEPVFLTGPAGSGKNVLCKQIAEALGLNFYFTNAVTQEYKLTGFTDAMGNYQETQFYKAFTQGGVFMLDEMDASIPEVLVILNAAIANRYFDFPAPIGYVEAHPDFRVIAAGNTTGHGADFEYVGRNQLDGASLDRFAIVKIDYSKNIEDSVANDIELADFCRDYRRAAENAGIQVIVSYRAIGRLAKMLQILSIEEALDTCLVKGLGRDDIHMIRDGIGKSNKYTDALEKLERAAA